jgi:hypothetical protein
VVRQLNNRLIVTPHPVVGRRRGSLTDVTGWEGPEGVVTLTLNLERQMGPSPAITAGGLASCFYYGVLWSLAFTLDDNTVKNFSCQYLYGRNVGMMNY